MTTETTPAISSGNKPLPAAKAPRISGRRIFRVIRVVWVMAGIAFLLWLNDLFRVRGVDDAVLHSDARITVMETDEFVRFTPNRPTHKTRLAFFPGGGVEARAYAPLIRAVAAKGYAATIIKLPYRFAPFASHRSEAIERAWRLMSETPNSQNWVVAGHSKGGAIASQFVSTYPTRAKALILIGTSYPKGFSLAEAKIPIVKIVATNDGVATEQIIESTKENLPPQTKWVRIEGGNHSQFGYYGHQLWDGRATISREEQQRQTLEAILQTLETMEGSGE